MACYPAFHFIPATNRTLWFYLSFSFSVIFLFAITVEGSCQSKSGVPDQKKGNFIFYSQDYKRLVEINEKSVHTNGQIRITDSYYSARGSLNGSIRTMKVAGELVMLIRIINSTCGYSSGSIVVEATNGTPPYKYEITDQYFYTYSQNTGNFQGIREGSWIIKAIDANGKTISQVVTVKDELPRVVSVVGIYKLPSTCIAKDGSITLTTTGGKPPYEYTIDGINYQSSPVFSGLAAGLYQINTRDANGCTYGTYVNFLFQTGTCSGGLVLSYASYECTQNGNIEIRNLPSGSGNTYSIDGNNYVVNGYFDNLLSGFHTLYVKSSSGVLLDVITLNIIHDCNIYIKYVTSDASCGINDGELTVTADNGTKPYTYSIDGLHYQTSNLFTGLAPGNYTVTVKDFNGNIASQRAVVYDRCPVVRAVSTGESCTGNDGTISAGGFKGTEPYQFSIDGVNFQSSNEFTGLTSGNYTVTMKDDNGITAVTQVMVDNACIPFTTSITNATCNQNNGEMKLTVTGGIAPFQYSVDGINYQTSNQFSNLAPGYYTVTVKDSGGRKASKSVTVSKIDPPIISSVIVPAGCMNTDGQVQLSVTKGVPPYEYSLDGINFQSADSFKGLSGGLDYTLTVKDQSGCKVTASVRITQNCPKGTATVLDETCSQKNGTITVAATDGTAPYQYSLDGISFQTSNVFSGLIAGAYNITIRDKLFYTNQLTVKVINVCPTVTAVVTKGLCGTAKASITATGANGAEPYSYSIDGVHFQTSTVFAGLPDGTYTVTVKDARNLTSTVSVTTINYPAPLVTVSGVNTGCLNNSGSVHIEANGSGPFIYGLTGFADQSTPDFKNLSKGDYTITVADANGCKVTRDQTISLTDDLVLQMPQGTAICEGKSVVLNLVANASAVSWAPAGSLSSATGKTPEASPVVTTDYTVNAILGICTKTGSVRVTVFPAPIANAGIDQQICFGQNAQLSGGGGISYQWSPATYLNSTLVSSPVVNKPTSSIEYSLIVKDARGCQSLSSDRVRITVREPARLFVGNDTVIVKGEPLPLKSTDVNNTGFVNYLWLPVNGLSNNKLPNPIATLYNDQTYYVTASTVEGCEGKDTIHIKVYDKAELFVPTAFTPNNDHLNDVLRVFPVGIKEFKYFRVFNQWGQEVFSTTDVRNGWDGLFKATPQVPGTYTWITAGIDYKGNLLSRRGIVMLIR